MTIDALTEFSGDQPVKGDMTVAEFDVAAEIAYEYLLNLAAQINTFVTQANAIGVSVNDLKAALASANFAGGWADLTGALNVPAVVTHDDQYWVLLTDLADVTASEPSDSNPDWLLFPTGSPRVSYTADHTITAAEMRHGNMTLDNYGASGPVAFDLPARNGDYRISFCVETAQYLRVNAPAGETISWGSESTASGGYIRSNVPGTIITIIGGENTEYRVSQLIGYVDVDE